MKSFIQAIIGTALAVLLGYMFIWVAKENLGLNRESATLDEYNNYMLQAKSYFVDNSDEIQNIGMSILDMDGLFLLRGKSGRVSALTEGGIEDASETLSGYAADDASGLLESLTALMQGYTVNISNSDDELLISEYTQVQSVTVNEHGIYFCTNYLTDGVVGFKYSKDGAESSYSDGYSTIALTDEWSIYYSIDYSGF